MAIWTRNGTHKSHFGIEKMEKQEKQRVIFDNFPPTAIFSIEK